MNASRNCHLLLGIVICFPELSSASWNCYLLLGIDICYTELSSATRNCHLLLELLLCSMNSSAAQGTLPLLQELFLCTRNSSSATRALPLRQELILCCRNSSSTPGSLPFSQQVVNWFRNCRTELLSWSLMFSSQCNLHIGIVHFIDKFCFSKLKSYRLIEFSFVHNPKNFTVVHLPHSWWYVVDRNSLAQNLNEVLFLPPTAEELKKRCAVGAFTTLPSLYE